MINWQEIWRFETRRFIVAFEVTDCEEKPEGCFSDERDVKMVLDGSVTWFDACVAVYLKLAGRTPSLIARDDLGCCSYESPEQMIELHRDSDPMNRNCTYFTSMVREAIGEVRVVARNLQDIA